MQFISLENVLFEVFQQICCILYCFRDMRRPKVANTPNIFVLFLIIRLFLYRFVSCLVNSHLKTELDVTLKYNCYSKAIFFTDVNECQTIPGVCQNGRCLNLQGGYRCQCQPGYRVSADGKRCIGKSDERCHQAWINPSCWRKLYLLDIKYLKYVIYRLFVNV